jgi:hypothetical protein
LPSLRVIASVCVVARASGKEIPVGLLLKILRATFPDPEIKMSTVYILAVVVMGLFALAFWQDFSFERRAKQRMSRVKIRKEESERKDS